MKKIIYYFTGTGNSLYIAKRLKEEIDHLIIQSISSIKYEEVSIINSRILGFMFPVYSLGLPRIVERFIKKVNIQDCDYIFAIATHGGRPGKALLDLKKLLKKKNCILNAGFNVKMPNNFIPLSNPPSSGKVKMILNKADKKILKIIKFIKQERNYKIERGHSFWSYILYYPLYRSFKKYVRRSDKNFYLNEKCSHCGICMKVCPVNNIQLTEDNVPKWQHNCELCLRCLHWCPEKAIEYGKKSRNRNRYHHPDISIGEIISN